MAKAKKKSKKKTSSLIMFVLATILFLACLSIAIAFSVIPYGLTSYSLSDKDNDAKYSFTLDQDYTVTIEMKKGDSTSDLTFEDKLGLVKPIVDNAVENGYLTPFRFKVDESFANIVHIETGAYVNGGNIAIVTVASIVGAIALVVAILKAKKAF